MSNYSVNTKQLYKNSGTVFGKYILLIFFWELEEKSDTTLIAKYVARARRWLA